MAFNFGTPSTQSQPLQTSFSFGNTAKVPATASSFGAATSKSAFSFQTPATTAGTAAPLGVKPLTLGGGATTAVSTATSTGGSAFSTGTSLPTLGGLGGGATATTSSSGFGFKFGPTTTTTASTGLSLNLGGATSGGLGLGKGLGGIATTTTTTTTGGLCLALGTSTSAATSSSGGLTLGGLGGTATQPATTSASVVKGLGGVDPTTNTKNASKAAGATGDGKRVKEGEMPNELTETVTKFKKYVKEQKDIGAKISVVSSLQMSKVQEQTKSLKHLLSTVSVGLHRNIAALDKLKKQTSQELHNAEMAYRTKETPPGLQYENTAPNQYFHDLMMSFEERMALYRKLIEDTEGYIVGAQQRGAVSPKDIFTCLKKLHETFIALAAQLHGIHEQVKEQKEHYLTFRRVFHGEETDIFEKRKRESSNRSKLSRTSQPGGPTPFTGLSNFAAMMMNSAMTRQVTPQQPGLTAMTAMPGFGTAATQPPTTGLFGNTSSLPTFGGFGTQPTTGGSLFGNTGTAKPAFNFGTATSSAAPAFGFSNSAAGTSKPFGFGFGSTTTTTNAGTSAFNLGSAPASKPTGFGFGSSAFGSAPAQSTTSLFGSAVKPLG